MARVNHCRLPRKRPEEIRPLMAMARHCRLEGDWERSEALLEHTCVEVENYKDLVEQRSIVGLCYTTRFLYDLGGFDFYEPVRFEKQYLFLLRRRVLDVPDGIVLLSRGVNTSQTGASCGHMHSGHHVVATSVPVCEK